MDEAKLQEIERCYEDRTNLSMHKIPRALEHIRSLILAVRYCNVEGEKLAAEVRRLRWEIERLEEEIENIRRNYECA